MKCIWPWSAKPRSASLPAPGWSPAELFLGLFFHPIFATGCLIKNFQTSLRGIAISKVDGAGTTRIHKQKVECKSSVEPKVNILKAVKLMKTCSRLLFALSVSKRKLLRQTLGLEVTNYFSHRMWNHTLKRQDKMNSSSDPPTWWPKGGISNPEFARNLKHTAWRLNIYLWWNQTFHFIYRSIYRSIAFNLCKTQCKKWL